jgi:carbonic anhydrase/acetyltransferase-like protein (isoleucine patch superfamily)
MEKYTEVCDEHGIEVAGILDHDYWGNTDVIRGVPVIGTERMLEDSAVLEEYRKKYNFFCASNWTPFSDLMSTRNREKRNRLIKLISTYNLNCISLVDSSTKIPKSSSIGCGVFIDGYVNIEPVTTIGDFTAIYSQAHIGHDSVIGRNCVFQRVALLASHTIVEDNVYFGIAAKAFKMAAKFGQGSFIHEGIYIRRGTIENEVVGMNSKNPKRVVPYLVGNDDDQVA